MNKNNKYEKSRNPLRINEIIRKEYPLLADRIEKMKENNNKLYEQDKSTKAN